MGTCGTCAQGTPDGYGLIECQLGWEAHDNLWHQDVRGRFHPGVTMGHAGVPLPLLSPTCRCMANGGTGHAVRKAA